MYCPRCGVGAGPRRGLAARDPFGAIWVHENAHRSTQRPHSRVHGLRAPAHKAIHYAATLPGIYGIPISFVAELASSIILTSAVLFALNHETLEPYAHYVAATLIATYIAFESPLSAMSANPARTFGPAVCSGYWHAFWIYFIAPPLGMLAAAQVLLARKSKVPHCAKLHHHNNKRCIFCHSGLDLTTPNKKSPLCVKKRLIVTVMVLQLKSPE